jgi:hypothetical protein
MQKNILGKKRFFLIIATEHVSSSLSSVLLRKHIARNSAPNEKTTRFSRIKEHIKNVAEWRVGTTLFLTTNIIKKN